MGAVVPFYVKTAYKEEPSFANAKIVTSLFSKALKKDLGQNFKKCLEFRDAKADLLEKYDDNFGFEELGKLAIDYSDGIIQASETVYPGLVDYAKVAMCPFLTTPASSLPTNMRHSTKESVRINKPNTQKRYSY